MLSALLLTLACSPPQEGDEITAWIEDTLYLIGELESMHPNSYFGCPRAEFEQATDEFFDGLEDSSENEALVEFMRLFARLSQRGREGHATVWPTQAHYLPLRFYGFSDGWFVVDADAGWEGWIGARLLDIEGVPVDEVCARVGPLLTRDNDWNLRLKLGRAFSCAEVLNGSGLSESSTHIRVRLERGGEPSELVVEGQLEDPMAQWMRPTLPPREGALWLEGHEHAYRLQVLEKEQALYVKFNQVTARPQADPPLTDFAKELVSLFEERELTKVIVDVRSNGGGDNTTFPPLIEALQTPSINRPGVLFGLIGRSTFSAAGNFVTVLERDTKAILLGEPTGGAPNQFGDARTVSLPFHRDLLVRVATRYHQFGSADDDRLTHEPHLAVPLRSADYFDGVDPVLRAALEYEPPR